MEYLLVALGGALGATARYGLTTSPLFAGVEFPLGTLAVNILGSFAIGLIAGFAGRSRFISPDMRVFLQVGICGGFTTFSSFSLEVFSLMSQQKYLNATGYVVVSVVGCVVGVMLGDLLSRALVGE